MTITIPRSRADGRCWLGSMQVLDDPARCLLAARKISQCKANNHKHPHMPGIWMDSPRLSGRGRGGGVGEHPITSSAAQKRLRGWPAEGEVCWGGLGRCEERLRRCDLGPLKNPAPLLPHATFLVGVEPPGRSFSQATPQSEPHTSTYNYTPDSLLQSSSPPSLSFLCVLSLAFVLDTLHSVAD